MKKILFKLRIYTKRVLNIKEEYVMMDRITGQLIIYDPVFMTFSGDKVVISAKGVPHVAFETMECLGRL